LETLHKNVPEVQQEIDGSNNGKNLDMDDDNDSTPCPSPKHHLHLQSHANMALAAECTIDFTHH